MILEECIWVVWWKHEIEGEDEWEISDTFTNKKSAIEHKKSDESEFERLVYCIRKYVPEVK